MNWANNIAVVVYLAIAAFPYNFEVTISILNPGDRKALEKNRGYTITSINNLRHAAGVRLSMCLSIGRDGQPAVTHQAAVRQLPDRIGDYPAVLIHHDSHALTRP